jgi:hypothetical protein
VLHQKQFEIFPSPGQRGKYGEHESKSQTTGRIAPFAIRPVTVVLKPHGFISIWLKMMLKRFLP